MTLEIFNNAIEFLATKHGFFFDTAMNEDWTRTLVKIYKTAVKNDNPILVINITTDIDKSNAINEIDKFFTQRISVNRTKAIQKTIQFDNLKLRSLNIESRGTYVCVYDIFMLMRRSSDFEALKFQKIIDTRLKLRFANSRNELWVCTLEDAIKIAKHYSVESSMMKYRTNLILEAVEELSDYFNGVVTVVKDHEVKPKENTPVVELAPQPIPSLVPIVPPAPTVNTVEPKEQSASTLQIFNNPQFGEVRVAGTSEEPLFCLADVCKALGIKNASDCKQRLKQPGVVATEVGVQTGLKADGTPAMQKVKITFITEPNLYKCVFQSRRPDAEKFQDWICEDVLPSIRKHGAYVNAQTAEDWLNNPDMMIKTLNALKEAREEKQVLQEAIQEASPKIEYADYMVSNKELFTLAQIALELKTYPSKVYNKLTELGIIEKFSFGYAPCAGYEHWMVKASGDCYAKRLYYRWTKEGRKGIHEIFGVNTVY